jgi:hypothetical protein
MLRRTTPSHARAAYSDSHPFLERAENKKTAKALRFCCEVVFRMLFVSHCRVYAIRTCPSSWQTVTSTVSVKMSA